MSAFVDRLSHVATLPEALAERVRLHAGRPWLTLYARDKVAARLTFGELQEGASAWAALLADLGVEPADRVVLILPTERSFYESYWGILLAGAVPVPVYPPVRLGRIDEYLDDLAGLVRNCAARVVITNDAVRPLVRPLEDRVPSVRFAVPRRVRPGRDAPQVVVAPADLGLLQYTSGSTGSQKGVMLTHGNLVANLRAIGRGVAVQEDDVAVSWLPLYHDMGLIGLMLGSLYFGIPLVAMSPIDFLRRPGRWLRAVTEHRGTLSAGPNFAYSLAARKMRPAELDGLDLSSWRVALCGAEPIHPATVDGFTSRFSSCGFRPEAFFPAYGLAENTLAVSFSDLDTPPHVLHVDAARLEKAGRAEPRQAGPGSRAVVSVGRPVPTVEVAVVDEADEPLPEGCRGEVVIRGPSVMKGYFDRPDATAETLRGGWLHTGDLGFVLDGRLYISGRRKDLVIKAGRNYFAEDLEAAAAGVSGVRPGGLAVFAVANPARGTEEVVLVAEVAQGAAADGLEDALRVAVADRTGCRPDRIALVPARTLPKTSSGKIQRFKARQWYLDGSLGRRGGERRTSGVGLYVRAWLRDKLRRPRR